MGLCNWRGINLKGNYINCHFMATEDATTMTTTWHDGIPRNYRPFGGTGTSVIRVQSPEPVLIFLVPGGFCFQSQMSHPLPPQCTQAQVTLGSITQYYNGFMQYKNVLLCPPVSQSPEGGRIRIRWCDPGCFELCIIFIVLCGGAIFASNGGVQFPFIVMCDLIDVLSWNSPDTRGTGNRAPSSYWRSII